MSNPTAINDDLRTRLLKICDSSDLTTRETVNQMRAALLDNQGISDAEENEANVVQELILKGDEQTCRSRTPAQRLTAARQRAGYVTRTSAAQALGWETSAYNHHEGGVRMFKVDQALQYAQAFGVNAAWLLGIESDIGEPPVMVVLPSDEILTAIIHEQIDGLLPGRTPSIDTVLKLVRALKDTLALLPKTPSASHDPRHARLLARGIIARPSRLEQP